MAPFFLFCCLDMLDMSYRNNVDFVLSNPTFWPAQTVSGRSWYELLCIPYIDLYKIYIAVIAIGAVTFPIVADFLSGSTAKATLNVPVVSTIFLSHVKGGTKTSA